MTPQQAAAMADALADQVDHGLCREAVSVALRQLSARWLEGTDPLPHKKRDQFAMMATRNGVRRIRVQTIRQGFAVSAG